MREPGVGPGARVTLAVAVSDPARGCMLAAALSSGIACGRDTVVLEGTIAVVLRLGPGAGPMGFIESRWILSLLAQGVSPAEALCDFAGPLPDRGERLCAALTASGEAATAAGDGVASRTTIRKERGRLCVGIGLAAPESAERALAILAQTDGLGPADRVLRALAEAGQTETVARGGNPFRSAVLQSGTGGLPSVRDAIGMGTADVTRHPLDLRVDDGEAPWEGLERLFDLTLFEEASLREREGCEEPVAWTEGLRREVAEALAALPDGERVANPMDSPRALARWFARRRLCVPPDIPEEDGRSGPGGRNGGRKTVDALRLTILRRAARRHCVSGFER